MILPLLVGCSEPLVPGEEVVGVDVAAERLDGAEGSRFGESLAWRADALAVAAPGARELWLDGEVTSDSARWVGWLGAELVRVSAEGIFVGEALVGPLNGAVAFAVSEEALFAASPRLLWRVGGAELELAGVEALAASATELAALHCNPDCGVERFDATTLTSLGEATTEAGNPLPAGPGGALAYDGGALCAGDPALDEDDGAGRVACTDGREVLGAQGDHLGRAIGGGYTAGQFNKWVVPARARIVSLSEGRTLAMEQGAEVQPITLAGGGEELVIGAPYYPLGGAPAGAVFRVGW